MFKKTFLSVLMMGYLIGPPALAAESAKKSSIDLQKIAITEQAGALLPLDLDFKNEKGETVLLQDFFDGKKPVIGALVYYECPSLCNLVLNGLTEALKKMDWQAGSQFQIMVVSINPAETPLLASQKKEAGWSTIGGHFLTGTKENIQKLADTLGFGFQYDQTSKEYIHAAALFIMTPNGKIARTLYGTRFTPRDLKLALVEAGEGKVGNWVDKLLVFLFKYDSAERKYKLNFRS